MRTLAFVLAKYVINTKLRHFSWDEQLTALTASNRVCRSLNGWSGGQKG